MNFTDNEKAVMRGSEKNEFGNALENGCPWSFAVIDASGLDPKVARGAIASLVKKGIVEVSDYGRKGKPEDQIFAYTSAGLHYALHALDYLTDEELASALELSP